MPFCLRGAGKQVAPMAFKSWLTVLVASAAGTDTHRTHSYSVVVQGGSSSTGAGAGGVNYSYAALVNRTVGTPYEGRVANMAHGNTDSLYSALVFSSLVQPGTRVVVWEFVMTDQFGLPKDHAIAWRFWMRQARVHDLWVIPVILWSEPPRLPKVYSASASFVRGVAAHEPSVLGIIDVGRLVSDRCSRLASCSRSAFISDSHHPNAALHEYIASELAAILAAHSGPELERGPSAALNATELTAADDASQPGEVLGLFSHMTGCKNTGVAVRTAARMLPAGIVRTMSWTIDSPMRPDDEQPLLRASMLGTSSEGPVSLAKESGLRLDRQMGHRLPHCTEIHTQRDVDAASGAEHAPFTLLVGKEGECTGGTITGMAWRAQSSEEKKHSADTSNQVVWKVTHALRGAAIRMARPIVQTLRPATDLCILPSRPAFAFAPIGRPDGRLRNQSRISSLHACYNGSVVAGKVIAIRAVSLFCAMSPSPLTASPELPVGKGMENAATAPDADGTTLHEPPTSLLPLVTLVAIFAVIVAYAYAHQSV